MRGAEGARSTLAPALIEGRIMHRRSRPAANAFVYRAFCLRLPLSALDRLPDAGIAHNRAGVVSFHDRDHGACDGTPLEPWIRGLLAREGVAADGEIVLYAFPRMLGYGFDPVSFWVCHDREGRMRAVLAEVRNTFGERHHYLVANGDGSAIGAGAPLESRKAFHVSPFCRVSGRYRFRFHEGDGHWLARVDYFDDDDCDAPLLATSIAGAAVPLDKRAVARTLWRYRWFTAGVIARIHWQALRLALKRVPAFAKPAPPATLTTR
jgi:DUF1365 family protein